MNKAELIKALAEKSGVSARDTDKVVRSLTDVVTAELQTGGEVNLPGLGKLVTAKRAARTAVSMSTGEEVHVPARTAAKFRVSSTLKASLNP